MLALPGMLGIARFLIFYAKGMGSGHVQSLVISAALIGLAAVVQMGGLIADIIAANRRLLEDIRARQLRSEIDRARAETARTALRRTEAARPQKGGAVVPISR